MTERVPASLLAALADLVDWLAQENVPAMIIGGVATSIMGRPRLTRDVDALVLLPPEKWSGTLDAAAGHGLVPRLDDALGFANRSRMLLLTHTRSSIDIDVSMGGLSFEFDALARSQIHQIGGVTLRLPCVEDLMIMKAFAHRPKDMQDIEGLLSANPSADLELVRRWLREFSTAMTMPELLDDFEKIVASVRQVRS